MPRLKENKFPKHNFVKFQPNPSWTGKGRYRHEDCPIRAICAAEQLPWEQVYDLLCISGKEVFDAPTSDDSIECCLKKLGYTRCSIKVQRGSKRPTVTQFAREHFDGTYVLRIAGHVVGVRNGEYYDCWDCGTKCVYTYYEKNLRKCCK